MKGADVAIVGAGIGGLTAAIALQKAGCKVRIYERADRLGDVGAGITITPNAWKGLAALGLGGALEAEADEVPHQAIRQHQSGAPIAEIPRGSVTRQTYGAPYVMLHRADLHKILVDAVRGVDANAILLGQGVNDAAQIDADAVIAADGIKSVVRSRVFADPEPRFTGHLAWRGLVPAERLPASASVPGSVVWAGPGRIFVRYPIRHGALVNFVGLTRSDEWRGEGWSQLAVKDDVLAEYAGWHSDIIDTIQAAEDDTIITWGLFAREPLKHIVEGRIALLGDAAHPMLPFMGQGAAMAIEDGVVLGRAFAGADSVTEALDRYAAARIPRTSFIQQESAAGADRLQFEVAKTAQAPSRTEDTLGIFHFDPATAPV
ncbi:MAG: FAD-dependent monooxygenase [Sphingomonadaceae bacterium]|nr:FAD-dependent monooxygenase [Sphingomonadaceae bacterium]